MDFSDGVNPLLKYGYKSITGNDDKETFGQTSSPSRNTFFIFMLIIAAYLAYICTKDLPNWNTNPKTFIEYVFALGFPPFYIVYRLFGKPCLHTLLK